jgi:hypothetical protein
MGPIALICATLLYLIAAVDLARGKNWPMAIVFVAYAVANAALVFVAYRARIRP